LKANFSETFEYTEYNLKFSIDDLDDLDDFGKSNILAIEENKSTLKVLKENEGIKE
jgi:hypothetical protein